MYNKNNIAIRKVASRSSIRPELACVAFYGDRTLATDSFRAVEMSATGKKKGKPDLYTARSLEAVKLKKGETVDDKTMPVKKAVGITNDYPNLDEVFKRTEGKPYASVRVNARYLAELCDLLKGLDPYEAITLKVPTESPYQPVIIEADNSRGPSGKEAKQTARAVLMPMNH